MAICNPQTINFMVLIMTMASIGFPTKTEALIPYNRPLWDMMMSNEDPFKILEENPLIVPKANLVDTINLARADWKETSGHHVISLDVPGMKRTDMKIEVEEGRVLKVSGERKAEEDVDGDRWHRAERTTGKFWRQFRLPANAVMEKTKAHLEDGVLKIKIPKVVQEKKQSKVIDIAGEESSGEDINPTNPAPAASIIL